MLWILKVDIQYLIAAQDRKSPVFLPGPRRLLPLCAPIKWDEGGQVGGAQLRLEHSGGHLRGQVNTTQPSHMVEIFVKEMNNKMSGWQLTLRAKLASYPSTAFFIFSSQDLKDKGLKPRLSCTQGLKLTFFWVSNFDLFRLKLAPSHFKSCQVEGATNIFYGANTSIAPLNFIQD